MDRQPAALRRVVPQRKPTSRCVWLVALAAAISAGSVSAETPAAGSNSRSARNDALQAIPLDAMDAEARQKATTVVNQTSIFRRLPLQVVDCDPRYFIFLLRHPEVIVSIWKRMDATHMTFERLGPERFRAEDGAGTVGRIEFLYGDHQTHVLYAEGAYEGPLTARPVRANCLLVLRSEYVPHENGRYYIANQMDMFIDVKNVGVELIAKTFQNMIGKATDVNFIETANFVSKLSRVTEKNGPGVQRMAAQLKGVHAETRQQFADHANRVYHAAQKRQPGLSTTATDARVTRAQDR